MVGLDIGYVFGSKQPQGVMLPATPFFSIPEETVLILLAMNINSFRQKLTSRAPCQSDWLQASILKIELISIILLSSWSELSNLANFYSFFKPFTPTFLPSCVYTNALPVYSVAEKRDLSLCVAPVPLLVVLRVSG